MAKSKFFKNTKQAKKDLPNVLKMAAIRSGSAVAASIIDTTVRPKIPATFQKYTGPGMFVLGMVGEAFISEKHLATAAQGIAAYGAIRTTLDLAPASVTSKMSLKGIDSFNGIGEDVNWDALAEEAARAKTVSGYEEEPISGDSEGEFMI